MARQSVRAVMEARIAHHRAESERYRREVSEAAALWGRRPLMTRAQAETIGVCMGLAYLHADEAEDAAGLAWADRMDAIGAASVDVELVEVPA